MCTYSSVRSHLACIQCFGGCKPFLTCLLLEHSLEMHHHIKCLHFLKLLLKLRVHGCKHKKSYIHRVIQMLTISIPFGSWGIVNRRFIRISLSRTYIFLSCLRTILKFRDQSRKFVPLSFSFSRTDRRVNVDVLFDAISLHTKICKDFNK